MVKRVRIKALVIAVGALGATVLPLAVAANAPARVSSSCGPCPLVATIKDGIPACKTKEAGQPSPRDCPPAAKYPLGASLHVLLANQAGTRIAGWVRFCWPDEYRHRNSCSPPGY
jgi:hypothetical protein